MSYFTSILRSRNAPARSEEEAIQTLSNRLQHATLSADRKSAVLGLKSFSRQFRESVVQYGLRALLSTLGKDTENADLVKAILETLLNLFLRAGDGSGAENETQGWISSQSRAQNGKYPSPLLVQVELDEFSDWIADEMISGEDHVRSLMSVVQQHAGFQIRLYALQMLEAVVATRPARAKECILNIPLAISTVVGLLDDVNDPIRNETILLLMALVNHNYNIQKLVAFENTFSRIFEIIAEEGGIRGSILVQDCMTLLTNLLMYNASNQTFFLETDCVPQLARLIAEPLDDVSVSSLTENSSNSVIAPPIVWTEQRLQNMAVLLEICRSFVDPENQHLAQNQEKLFSSGIFLSVLRLVYSPVMENPIRKVALQVTGDIIANNAPLQLEFASIDVPYVDPSMPLQVQRYDDLIPAPVALLNWVLLTNSVHIFEVRLAAMHCLAKFFSGNTDAKMAFLTDQVEASKNPRYYVELKQQQEREKSAGDNEREDEKEEKEKYDTSAPSDVNSTPYANIFSILTTFNPDTNLNPYSVWFSAITLVYLISECPESRQKALESKVGDTDAGEEEMTAIQAISGMLVASLENSDPRIASGYLILLTLWLFEDFGAVDDFLSDVSVIKSLVSFLSKSSEEASEIVQGMTAVLVGICYDFSTKASPFSRDSLYELITKGLGPDSYALKIKQFKNNPLLKQFDGDLESGFEKDASGLPNLYFIPEYADLVKDNYYRIRKALSRGPEFEPRSRISFEVFEELESKNVELTQAFSDLTRRTEESEKALKEQVAEKEQNLEKALKSLDEARSEVKEARQNEDDLVEKIEKISEKLNELRAEKEKYEQSSAHYTSEFHKLSKKSAVSEDSLKQTSQKLKDVEAAKQKAEDGINKMSRELFQLTKQQKESEASVFSLKSKLEKTEHQHENAVRDFEAMAEVSKKTNEDLKKRLAQYEEANVSLTSDNTRAEVLELEKRIHDMEATTENLMEKLRAAASVVSSLRVEKVQLEQTKAGLEVELAQAYEDLEAFVGLMDEIEEIRGESSQNSGDETVSKSIESLKEKERELSEEKEKLEERLSESARVIENLNNTISSQSLKVSEKQVSEDEVRSDEQNLSEQQTEISKLTSEVADLTKDLESLRSELSVSKEALEREKTRSQKAVDAIHHEHAALTEKYEKLKADSSKEESESNVSSVSNSELVELEIAGKRIRDLERNIEVLSESASTSLASFKTSQDSLKARITYLEQNREKLLDEIEERKEERAKMIVDFQEAYDELESSFMDLELSSSNVEKHKDELESKLKKLEHESSSHIDKLKAERETLTKQLNETREERDELRKEYYELEKSTNIIGSELQAKEALLQAISNKGADLAAKDKIVIEIKEKLAHTIADLGDSAQKLRVLSAEKGEINKNYTDSKSSLEEAKQELKTLEFQLAEKSTELEKSRAETKRLAASHMNLAEANKTNSENTAKIEGLENKILRLQASLNEVNALLDEQRKLNCENSSAATLELTENSSKLEKSIRESQELHESEITLVREASESEVRKLEESVAALEQEKGELMEKLEKLSEHEKVQSEADSRSGDVAEYEQRHEESVRKLEELTKELKSSQSLLEEKQLEVNETERKLEEVSSAHEHDIGKNVLEIEELKSQLEKLTADASEREVQFQDLSKEKEELARSYDLQKSVASSESEKTLAKLEETRDELARTDADLEQKVALLEKLQQLAEDLERKVSELENREETQIERENETASDETKLSSESETLPVSKFTQNGVHTLSISSRDREEIEQLQSEINLLQEERKSDQETHTEYVQKLNHSISEKAEALENAEKESNIQKEKLNNLSERLEQIQESWEQRLGQQKQSWTEKVDEAERTRSENEKEILGLKDEIAKLEREVKEKASTEIELENKEQAVKPVADEKKTEEVAATADDFADLVLLCDHQEHKIEKYRRKLRALDIVVSSDESDEDLL